MTLTRPMFPPPPDVEPTGETDFAPIIFAWERGALVAKLGVNTVGEVRRNPFGVRVQAYWTCWLLPESPKARPASSIDAGRQALGRYIRDWFEACGHPLPQGGRR